MSKGKKQALTLAGLCVLMAAAIILYFLVPQGEDENNGEQESTSETVRVFHVEKDNITAISVTREGEDPVSLRKEEGGWKLEDLPEAPVDQEAVEGMFQALNPVTATKELAGDSGSKQEYGLEKPQMTVKITTSDGKSQEIHFGDTVPVSGGNYGMTADSDKIYTFTDALYNSLYVEKNTLIAKEEIKDINADYLTKISVKNKNKITFLAEIVPDDKKVDAYTNWVISEPYKKPLAGSSTNDWATLQGFYTAVSFDELVEYQCSDKKKYGLDDPAAEIQVGYFDLKDGYEIPEEKEDSDSASTVGKSSNKANVVPKEYQDTKGYTLYVGKKDENGSYYVSLKGSQNVYTLSADKAESMMGADAYTYMDHSVYSTLASDIKGYEMTIGRSGKKITVTHDSEQGEDGKEKNIWTLNGKTVPADQEDAFLTPYSKAFLLEFTSAAKDSVKPESEKPVLTAVYHEEDRDVTVRYLPYDGTNFYRVDKDGMDYFLVDKMSVDAVIEAFESLSDLDLQEKK